MDKGPSKRKGGDAGRVRAASPKLVSLYTKLVLIIFVLIIALMVVTGVFLTRGVRSFYTDDFYEQMQEVFASPGLAEDLRDGAAADDYEHMAAIIRTYAGQLGIDSGTRNFHILSGTATAMTRTPAIWTLRCRWRAEGPDISSTWWTTRPP